MKKETLIDIYVLFGEWLKILEEEYLVNIFKFSFIIIFNIYYSHIVDKTINQRESTELEKIFIKKINNVPIVDFVLNKYFDIIKKSLKYVVKWFDTEDEYYKILNDIKEHLPKKETLYDKLKSLYNTKIIIKLDDTQIRTAMIDLDETKLILIQNTKNLINDKYCDMVLKDDFVKGEDDDFYENKLIYQNEFITVEMDLIKYPKMINGLLHQIMMQIIYVGKSDKYYFVDDKYLNVDIIDELEIKYIDIRKILSKLEIEQDDDMLDAYKYRVKFNENMFKNDKITDKNINKIVLKHDNIYSNTLTNLIKFIDTDDDTYLNNGIINPYISYGYIGKTNDFPISFIDELENYETNECFVNLLINTENLQKIKSYLSKIKHNEKSLNKMNMNKFIYLTKYLYNLDKDIKTLIDEIVGSKTFLYTIDEIKNVKTENNDIDLLNNIKLNLLSSTLFILGIKINLSTSDAFLFRNKINSYLELVEEIYLKIKENKVGSGKEKVKKEGVEKKKKKKREQKHTYCGINHWNIIIFYILRRINTQKQQTKGHMNISKKHMILKNTKSILLLITLNWKK